MDGQPHIIVIKGVTRSGRRFRPGDWAQRLATAVATMDRGRRIRFHPAVNIAVVEGVDSIVVNASLEREEPMLFRFLLNFARDNDLEVRDGRSDH